jgi:hypothetical protein
MGVIMVTQNRDIPVIERSGGGIAKVIKPKKHCSTCVHDLLPNDCKHPDKDKAYFKNLEMDECWEKKKRGKCKSVADLKIR